MYYFNKIVGWLISPLGFVFVCVAAGCLLRMWGNWGRKVAALLLVGSLSLLWLLGANVTTRIIGAPLEAPFAREGEAHGSVAGLPCADAIVLLGGGVGTHEKCGAAELFGAADRAWQAARLYKARKAPFVVISGTNVTAGTVEFLGDLGVDRTACRIIPEARNTEEEARLIAEAMSQVKVKGKGQERSDKILLVTSAWHMRRAQLIFRRRGFEVIPAPTDFEMSAACEGDFSFSEFLPTADGLAKNSSAFKEWIAYWGYYFLRK